MKECDNCGHNSTRFQFKHHLLDDLNLCLKCLRECLVGDIHVYMYTHTYGDVT